MPQNRTGDDVQGRVLAALPWEGGLTTRAVAERTKLGEDVARSALEDLFRRGMVAIDAKSYWRKKGISESGDADV